MNFEPRFSDGAYIYAFVPQQIARIPVGGGAQETVVGGIDTSVDWSLLVAGDYVYWTVADSTKPTLLLFRAAKAGGDQPTYLTGTGVHLVADDAFVYSIVDWMGNGNGLVSVAQSDGRARDEQIGGGGSVAGVDSACVLVKTGQRTSWSTFAVIEPSNMRRKPPNPCVPITIRSVAVVCA